MGQDLIDLGVDFETFYDASDYTLRKLTTAEYIHDPRFEIIGVGLVLHGALPVWISGTFAEIQTALAKLPWHRIRVIAHNAIFDGAILEWKLGFKPAKYLCTMMGVRPYVTPYTGRMDLRTTLLHLALGHKGTEVDNHSGRRRNQFTPEQLRAYGDYCCDDASGSVRIAEFLSSRLPDDEMDVIDLTIKKFTRSQLLVDSTVLQQHIDRISAEKAALIGALGLQGIKPEQMRSRMQFQKLLESKGVTVPVKISATTGRSTAAMSKQDQAFVDLLDHPVVGSLVAARFKLASNMEETRLLKIRSVAAASQGRLPAPLLYYGAHTGRFSGLDGINLQNLPRVRLLDDGSVDPKSGSLRFSLVAPPGYVVVAADMAQVEARITATLAGCRSLIDAFAAGRDVYSEFATQIYARKITKADKTERFVGKTCILGLGFGMGPDKFLKQMGLAKVPMTLTQAKDIVYLYRRLYAGIPELWQRLEAYAAECRNPQTLRTWGPLTFLHNQILLPNGMPLIYPELKADAEGLAYHTYSRGSDWWTRLWGGAVTENVVQALARIILTRAELRLARAGLYAALQVHDELVFVVPEARVEAVKKAVRLAMTAPVDFLPDLPLAIDIAHGPSYGDTK